MTRDEAVARIQRGLGFRTDLYDEVVMALQEARRNLETGKSLPDFLLQVDQSMNITTGVDINAYPERFLREFQEESFWYIHPSDPDHIIWLEKLDFKIANSRFSSIDPGPPVAYTLRSGTIEWWPVPDTNYTLTWSYYKKSVELTSNVTDNEWLADDDGAPEALIGRAGMIIAADLEDTTSLQKFAAMYKAAWDAITSEGQLQDEENRPLAVGARTMKPPEQKARPAIGKPLGKPKRPKFAPPPLPPGPAGLPPAMPGMPGTPPLAATPATGLDPKKAAMLAKMMSGE